MLASLAERPVAARALAAVLFALVAAAFALPVVVVTVDERRAEATGLELAGGDAEITGRYVHAAYEGEAEALVEDAGGPARVVLGLVLAGLALVWLPGRAGFAAGAALGGLAVLALLVLHQTSTSAFDLADADLRPGFPLALAAAAAAVAWCSFAASRALFWWRPKPPPARDYFPEKT